MADRNIAIAVLAAGASRRFGEGDKLTAMFRGRMLGEAVCASVPQGCFDRRWVIASAQHHPCAAAWCAHGFDVAINPDASGGMGTSVALAARIALEADCDALVIALADMPLVPPEHFTALTARIAAASADAIIVSQAGGKRMPPAAFGADRLPALTELGGDTGARAILTEGEAIVCPPEWLTDIDTPGDVRKHGQTRAWPPKLAQKGEQS